MRVVFERGVREALPKPPRTEPFPSPQVYTEIRCPYCGSKDLRSQTVKPRERWFRCNACDLKGGPEGTAFRVPVRPGDPALVMLDEARRRA